MSPSSYQYISKIKQMILDRFGYVNSDIALFIACLSALETSYGRSFICLENHNLFGMKYPKIRLTTAFSEFCGHACYQSEMSSICDFFYWLQYYGFNRKHLTGSFYSFVRKFRSSPYNPHFDYVDTVLNIMSNFNSYKNGKN